MIVQEDYERDFLKDAIYLQEAAIELYKEVETLHQDVARVSAKIKIIKEETKEHDGKTRSELLPF